MKAKQKYLGLLLGILILTGTAGCSSLNEIEDTVQSSEKSIVEEFLKEEFLKEESPENEIQENELPEKEIQEEQAAFYYGYHSLAEEEQKVYRQLVKGLEEFQEEIITDPVPEERLERITDMVMVDHPEYFWIEGAFTYYLEKRRDGSVADIKLVPKYLLGKEEADILKQQIERKAEEWINGISPETDTYGKIKYVYETLIREVSYDPNSEQNQNIRSVFLGGSTVCMGYSKAAQYLLNKMGIFCTLVTGDIIGEEIPAHAWNLVKIDEQYYYMDITWGNPGYTDSLGTGPDIYYSYLCCNDETLAPTHVANDDIPLPQCSDDSYNYYKNKGCWYEGYDRNQIYQVLLENIRPENHMTEMRFASKEAYEQAVADLVEGNLIDQAVQNADNLLSGQGISWQVYYGGSDYLLVIVWN